MTYGKLSRVHGNGLGEHLQPEAGQKMVVYLELIDPLGTEMVDISVLGKVQAHLNITGEEDFSVPFELNEQMGTLEVRCHMLGVIPLSSQDQAPSMSPSLENRWEADTRLSTATGGL